MDRQKVLNIMLRHLANNVQGIDPKAVDPVHSMGDYGATSLDMLEVVAAAGEELDVRIPRTKLSRCRSLNEVVDLFLVCSAQ